MARNTGDCPNFIVKARGQVVVTAPSGGAAVASQEIRLGKDRTLAFEATCSDTTTAQGRCRGEVTIVLNQMK